MVSDETNSEKWEKKGNIKTDNTDVSDNHKNVLKSFIFHYVGKPKEVDKFLVICNWTKLNHDDIIYFSRLIMSTQLEVWSKCFPTKKKTKNKSK